MLYVPIINVFPDQPRPYKTVPIRIVAVRGERVTTAPPSLKLETPPLPKWSYIRPNGHNIDYPKFLVYTISINQPEKGDSTVSISLLLLNLRQTDLTCTSLISLPACTPHLSRSPAPRTPQVQIVTGTLSTA